MSGTGDGVSAKHDGRVIRGAVLTFRDDPAVVGPQRAVRFYRRGAVVVAGDGHIAWRGYAARLPERFRTLPADDYGDALVLAGFIDAHVHFPQYRMLAAPGKDLLDWLNRFTFPEERRYSSAAHASAAAEVFLDRLVQHGTTAAVVFSTVHRGATEALFAAAGRRRQAIVSGKTMMDCNAPEALRDDPASGSTRHGGTDRTLASPRPAALRDHRTFRGDLDRGPAPDGRRARRPVSRLPRPYSPLRRARARSRSCGGSFRGRRTTPVSTIVSGC